MRQIKKGEIVTLKPEYLDPGEANDPHVALEDSWHGWDSIKVQIATPPANLRFVPINDWKLEWIAE